jgi:hypothetical protein
MKGMFKKILNSKNGKCFVLNKAILFGITVFIASFIPGVKESQFSKETGGLLGAIATLKDGFQTVFGGNIQEPMLGLNGVEQIDEHLGV